MAIIALPDGIV